MQNTYRIVAIRAGRPEKVENAEQNLRVQQIQRAMYGRVDWLYFYHDVYIDDDIIERQIPNGSEMRLYDLPNIHIDICALVGKNGTGKSSLVDLMIRTVNNVSAALIGEHYRFPAAEHLHYIEDVYSDLCIEHDNQFDIIKMRGRDVVIKHYTRNRNLEGWYTPLAFADAEIFSYQNDYTDILTPYASPEKPIEGCVNLSDKDNYVKILRDFCYTLVCDYSIYDFNYRNYTAERTPNNRLSAIYATGQHKGYEIATEPKHWPEDAIWLKGLFYKNDDYQTPIVIHPMRTHGVIDIDKEHFLSKERLLSLFFYKDKDNEYPFRVINGKLRVSKVRLTRSDVDYGDKKEVIQRIGVGLESNLSKNYDTIVSIIGSYWLSVVHLTGKTLDSEDQAVYEYIIYKTIKIAWTYNYYRELKDVLNETSPSWEDICSRLDRMRDDTTHRTRKLCCALHYLQTDIYKSHDGLKEYDIDSLCNRIEEKTIRDIQSYLPPPVFDIDFILSNETCDTIEFSHLSAGEKQIAYTIGGFLYHVINVESAWNIGYGPDNSENARYQYMNVVFDEVEQYFHPDLQRRFVSLLLTGLASVKFQGVKAINIIIVTHSPFILSDIPSNNILVLTDNHQPDLIPETYGGNISEMLGYPFFMDYSIGEFAKQKLEQIIQQHDRVLSGDVDLAHLAQVLPTYEYLVGIVGDSFVKEMLTDMLVEIKQIIQQSNV